MDVLSAMITLLTFLPNFLKQMQAGTRHIGKVYAPEDLDDKEKEMRGLNKKTRGSHQRRKL